MNFKKTVVIAAAAGALTALAIPAMADVTPYASIRLGTFWDTNTPAQAVGAAKPKTNTDFVEGLNGTSRFGALFSNGNLSGKVELGIGAFNVKTDSVSYGNGGATEVYTREAYGAYKFDFGTLLVGQTYTPYTFASAQVAYDDNVSNGFGSLYDGRQPQVKLTLNNGLYVDLIRNGGNAANANAGDTTSTNTFGQVLFPRLAVGYEGKVASLAYGVGVAGQTFSNQSAVAGKDITVTSILGYAHGVYTAGPAALAFNVGVGQNLADFGVGGVAGAGAACNFNKAVYSTDGTVRNVTQISLLAQGTYQVSPTIKSNVGVGYVTESGKNADGSKWAKDDNRLALFVNAPITLAKNVTVVPEISYIDMLNQSNGSKGFKDVIYGAKWHYDF